MPIPQITRAFDIDILMPSLTTTQSHARESRESYRLVHPAVAGGPFIILHFAFTIVVVYPTRTFLPRGLSPAASRSEVA